MSTDLPKSPILSPRRVLRVLGTIAALAVAIPFCFAAPPEGANQESRTMVAGANQLGFSLLRELSPAAGADANVFLSPLSIGDAMQLALAGAGGQTRAEIAATLGLGHGIGAGGPGPAAQALHAVLAHVDPNVELTAANAVWARNDLPLNPAYTAYCARYYGARAIRLDFNRAAAGMTINAWVKRQTRGKIDGIVANGPLSGQTAILTNAVYFHGRWSDPFSASATSEEPFTTGAGTKITVPMMRKSGSFAVLENDRFQAVRLPYGDNGRIGMVIVLPRAGVTVGQILAEESAASFRAMTDQMSERQIDLGLPRFHIEYRASLVRPLAALGIKDGFGSRADFSPMGLHGSFISDVVHKTMMDVDEHGTVAAGATGVMMSAAIAMPSTRILVDHPFLCALIDERTGAALFVGVVNHPERLTTPTE